MIGPRVPDVQDEIQALQQVISALTPLDDVARGRVLSMLNIYLGKEPPAPPAGAVPGSERGITPTPEAGSVALAVTDIRSYKDAKNPSNAIEMATVAAYYLSDLAPITERSADIAPVDIDRLFKQAGFRLPQAPRQVLPNAKAAGYFDQVDRGHYRLNPVGHNLVVHELPREGSERQSRASRPATRKARKRSAPKTAKKRASKKVAKKKASKRS